MTDEKLNPETTALVIIDLQIGVTGMDTKPYSAEVVIKNSSRLAFAAREKGMIVFPVNVSVSREIALSPASDSTWSRSSPPPKNWSEFVPELQVQEGDVVITKRQWGAFYGTDLDLQLRRRGIKTIILCGIATTYGVESTARVAYELGYNQVFAEDAMSDVSEESHNMSINFVLKRVGHVRTTEQVLEMF